MMEIKLTYQEALSELTDIVQQLESESIPIDELADKVKRASALIHYCQSRLTATDTEVKKIISQLENKAEL
jgi:exodeoxyribonuclease VII small subunit